MERRDFLKNLSVVGAIVAAAPLALAQGKETPKTTKPTGNPPIAVDLSSRPPGMTVKEMLEIWEQTGSLPYPTIYSQI